MSNSQLLYEVNRKLDLILSLPKKKPSKSVEEKKAEYSKQRRLFHLRKNLNK